MQFLRLTGLCLNTETHNSLAMLINSWSVYSIVCTQMTARQRAGLWILTETLWMAWCWLQSWLPTAPTWWAQRCVSSTNLCFIVSSLTITLDSLLCQDLEPLQQDVHQDQQSGADPSQQHHCDSGPECARPQPGRAGKWWTTAAMTLFTVLQSIM